MYRMLVCLHKYYYVAKMYEKNIRYNKISKMSKLNKIRN